MITFLSSPKSFAAANDRENQYRAVRSWLAASPSAQVILYGTSPGIDEAGRDLGVQVAKDVECAPSGIPYFGELAEHAARNGKYDLQVYLNCDILLSGIAEAMARIELPKFLMLGQRIDLVEGAFVDITARGWRQELLQAGTARLHDPAGKDYFGFRRGLWHGLPPVVTGRGWYDNALLAFCVRKRVPVIDATLSVFALHQFHDYRHVAGGNPSVRFGPDSLPNVEVTGGRHSVLLVSDADYILQNGALRRWPCRGDRLRRAEIRMRYVHGCHSLAMAMRALWRLAHLFHLRRKPPQGLEAVLAGAD